MSLEGGGEEEDEKTDQKNESEVGCRWDTGTQTRHHHRRSQPSSKHTETQTHVMISLKAVERREKRERDGRLEEKQNTHLHAFPSDSGLTSHTSISKDSCSSIGSRGGAD